MGEGELDTFLSLATRERRTLRIGATMASVIQSNFRIRKNLGRIQKVIEVPNLIDIQKSSYDKFLQSTIPSSERTEVGLQAVFRSVFPIKDFNGTSELVFVS